MNGPAATADGARIAADRGLKMKKILATCVLAAALMGPAVAQNAGLDPNYGTLNLNAGFTPDPRSVSVTAGGSVDGNALPGACTGMISDAPDVRVNYSAGGFPLAFRTRSSGDTTLLITGPDGRWYCDDDSGGGTNAQVVFSNPASGQYDVWVGHLSGSSSATVQVTETP